MRQPITGNFKFERDAKKHYVRKEMWLPWCRQQLDHIRSTAPRQKDIRRLKYFTLCAIGAIDVLCLDVENVIRCSSAGKFDEVYFFQYEPEDVAETKKRIPGAIGFPGDLIKVALLDDDINITSTADEDVRDTRIRERELLYKESFVHSFPFDVINLDLEGLIFKKKEKPPGDVMRMLAKMLEWQKKDIISGRKRVGQIDSFVLLFTMQISPENIGDEYTQKLKDVLEENMNNDQSLRDIMQRVTSYDDVDSLQQNLWAFFVKISIQKVIISCAKDHDWYIDAATGIEVYEIVRQSVTGPYTMVHLAMTIRRQNPNENNRMPGSTLKDVSIAYKATVRKIFKTEQVVVSKSLVEPELQDLQAHFDRVISRRHLYYPEAEERIDLQFFEE